MTLYRKYRPKNFQSLVGQDHIRDTILQAVKEKKLSQAYLFTGPRGTGKTTTARLLAKVANCRQIAEDLKNNKEISGEPCGKCDSCLEIADGRALDIIEIDAASNRGIDEIRELREQVRYAPSKSKFKIYIIDEVHMLTREAFNALLKTLEEPPAHAIFVLATTEPHKVLPTIISRTQRFDFKRIPPADLVRNMKNILKSEKIEAENEALEMIANLAEGGGRDSLSLLEQVITYSNTVDTANVRIVLGIAELGQIISLLRAIFNSDAEEGLKIAHTLFVSGTSLVQLNTSVIDVLRKLLNLAVAGSFLASDTKENKVQIQTLFDEINEKIGSSSQSEILAVTRSFIDASKIMKETIDPLVAIEIAVVESCDMIISHGIISSKVIMGANSTKLSHSIPVQLESSGLAAESSLRGVQKNYEKEMPKTEKKTVEISKAIDTEKAMEKQSLSEAKKVQNSEVNPKDLKVETVRSKTESEMGKGEPSHQPNDEVGSTAKFAAIARSPEVSGVTKQSNNSETIAIGGPHLSGLRKMCDVPQNAVTIEPSSAKAAEDRQSGNGRTVPLAGISDEIWGSVINGVKKENSTLAALLKDAKPMTVDDGKIVLGVRFKFHKDKISEARNVSVLEGVICNVTGNSCRVYCEIADFSTKKPKVSHSDDELAAEAERVFSE